MSPRIGNVILGVWLFISAFLWQHSPAQFMNTWIVGALTVLVALVATRYGELRYLNTALSVWLFISAWALPHFNIATVWNNAIVGLAIFCVSLVPTDRYLAPRGPSGLTGPGS